MDPVIASALIGAGGNLLGGALNRDSASKTRDANIQMQEQAMYLNSIVGRVDQGSRVGISPLASIGASMNLSPAVIAGDTSMGDAVGKAGQDLGRAAGALATKEDKMAALNEQLLRAKIDNVNADTVRMQAEASKVARTYADPATGPGVPFPTPDPRGVVHNLVERFRDPRTGEIVWLPSEKAASPLQTIAASPTNLALAGRGASEGLMGFDGGRDNWSLPTVRPDVYRNLTDYSVLGAQY